MKIKLIDFGYKKAPERKHYNDTGADVYVMGSFRIRCGETIVIPCGFGIDLPNGYNADLGGVEYHKHSDYIKQIISEKGMGNKNSKYVADVLMYDKQGNLLNRFQTAREAARYLGNESKNVGINYCLNGKQKTAYGYIWKYDKD